MPRSATLYALFAMILAGLLGSSPEAHAKRLGGGGSFGGKSAFSKPYQRSLAPVRTPRQQQANQRNQAARQQYAQRGGFMGMLGGLALGGLLGAMFFGGAFENLNLFDILVFGAIAWMLFKLLGARAARTAPRTAATGPSGGIHGRGGPDDGDRGEVAGASDGRTGRGNGFDSSDWFRAGVPDQETGVSEEAVPAGLPSGFDGEAFLAGARNAYRDLQRAWDAQDHDTLRALTSPSMFREVEQRLSGLTADNRTDVLKVDAELLEVIELDDMFEAAVLFDALLREERGERPRQVREVWHFTRPRASTRPTWFLDGIQQLAD